MAEKQVDTTGDVVANRPSGDEVVIQGSVDELIAAAPEPSDEAKTLYRTQYPTDQFVAEGLPVVTSAGTPLTEEQAEKLLPLAEASGVTIVEVGE